MNKKILLLYGVVFSAIAQNKHNALGFSHNNSRLFDIEQTRVSVAFLDALNIQLHGQVDPITAHSKQGGSNASSVYKPRQRVRHYHNKRVSQVRAPYSNPSGGSATATQLYTADLDPSIFSAGQQNGNLGAPASYSNPSREYMPLSSEFDAPRGSKPMQPTPYSNPLEAKKSGIVAEFEALLKKRKYPLSLHVLSMISDIESRCDIHFLNSFLLQVNKTDRELASAMIRLMPESEREQATASIQTLSQSILGTSASTATPYSDPSGHTMPQRRELRPRYEHRAVPTSVASQVAKSNPTGASDALVSVTGHKRTAYSNPSARLLSVEAARSAAPEMAQHSSGSAVGSHAGATVTTSAVPPRKTPAIVVHAAGIGIAASYPAPSGTMERLQDKMIRNAEKLGLRVVDPMSASSDAAATVTDSTGGHETVTRYDLLFESHRADMFRAAASNPQAMGESASAAPSAVPLVRAAYSDPSAGVPEMIQHQSAATAAAPTVVPRKSPISRSAALEAARARRLVDDFLPGPDSTSEPQGQSFEGAISGNADLGRRSTRSPRAATFAQQRSGTSAMPEDSFQRNARMLRALDASDDDGAFPQHSSLAVRGATAFDGASVRLGSRSRVEELSSDEEDRGRRGRFPTRTGSVPSATARGATAFPLSSSRMPSQEEAQAAMEHYVSRMVDGYRGSNPDGAMAVDAMFMMQVGDRRVGASAFGSTVPFGRPPLAGDKDDAASKGVSRPQLLGARNDFTSSAHDASTVASASAASISASGSVEGQVIASDKGITVRENHGRKLVTVGHEFEMSDFMSIPNLIQLANFDEIKSKLAGNMRGFDPSNKDQTMLFELAAMRVFAPSWVDALSEFIQLPEEAEEAIKPFLSALQEFKSDLQKAGVDVELNREILDKAIEEARHKA